jgi:hypothetical protein
LRIVNPLEIPGWDELLLKFKEATIFHSAGWARVLGEAYGYHPAYAVADKGNGFETLMPMMDVQSRLTGRRGVSLPFTDFCEPLARDRAGFEGAVKLLLDHGRSLGWRHMEWRGGGEYFQGEPSTVSYYQHHLDLRCDEKSLFSSFRRSTKTNINHAEKKGLRIEITEGASAVKAFHRLNRITHKLHGLPPQPFLFFQTIHKHLFSRHQGLVALAIYHDKPVAGALFLHFGKQAIYKYAALDRKYQHLRPSNLVIWEALKWYGRRGFEILHFGRTEPENTGLLQFKRGWGVVESTVRYYRYDFGKGAFSDTGRSVLRVSPLLKRCPLPLLSFAGWLLYKHMG